MIRNNEPWTVWMEDVALAAGSDPVFSPPLRVHDTQVKADAHYVDVEVTITGSPAADVIARIHPCRDAVALNQDNGETLTYALSTHGFDPFVQAIVVPMSLVGTGMVLSILRSPGSSDTLVVNVRYRRRRDTLRNIRSHPWTFAQDHDSPGAKIEATALSAFNQIVTSEPIAVQMVDQGDHTRGDDVELSLQLYTSSGTAVLPVYLRIYACADGLYANRNTAPIVTVVMLTGGTSPTVPYNATVMMPWVEVGDSMIVELERLSGSTDSFLVDMRYKRRREA